MQMLSFKDFKELGSLGLQRLNMPQIDPMYYDEFIKFLDDRMIDHVYEMVNPKELTPTQDNFHRDRVNQKIQNKSYLDKAIIISLDNYVIDGHHAWCAAVEDNADVLKCLVIDKPILDCLRVCKEFANVTFKQ